MKFPHNCCTKFIIKVSVQQPSGSFPDPIQISMYTGKHMIVGRTGLDIHGNLVDQVSCCEIFYHGGAGTVGIELHIIAQLPDPAEKFRQLRCKCGFTAGNTDAIENPLSFFQKSQDFLLGIFRLGVRLHDKSSILAEWAAEVATA